MVKQKLKIIFTALVKNAVRQMADLVYFHCVHDGSKLRVRVTSPGYQNEANCQFPRDIRRHGAVYSAPQSAVTLARGPAGKYFYRVSKGEIQQVDGDAPAQQASVKNVYDSGLDSCVVCMDIPNQVVVVPCGHYCLCSDCGESLRKSSNMCPMCRGHISLLVTRDQLG